MHRISNTHMFCYRSVDNASFIATTKKKDKQTTVMNMRRREEAQSSSVSSSRLVKHSCAETQRLEQKCDNRCQQHEGVIHLYGFHLLSVKHPHPHLCDITGCSRSCIMQRGVSTRTTLSGSHPFTKKHDSNPSEADSSLDPHQIEHTHKYQSQNLPDFFFFFNQEP